MSPSEERKAALRQRTKSFAGAVVRAYGKLDRKRDEVRVVGQQLLRSATSVAANYREASRSRSGAEFISKIELCAQEADETQLWLELLQEDCGVTLTDLASLWQEANELIAIFVTMAKRAKG